MCVRIRYKNGSKKKYDPAKDLGAQIKDMESLEISGRTTRKEKKMVLSVMAAEIERNHKKLEKKFEEIQLSLKGAKK